MDISIVEILELPFTRINEKLDRSEMVEKMKLDRFG